MSPPEPKSLTFPEQLTSTRGTAPPAPETASTSGQTFTLNASAFGAGSAEPCAKRPQSAGCLSRSAPAETAASARCFSPVRADFWQERSVRAQPAAAIPRTYRRRPTPTLYASEVGR
jgi:hypothetical protein